MTSETQVAAHRATLSPVWAWIPGMRRLRYAPGKRDHLQNEGRVPDGKDTWDYDAWSIIPDLDDPATVGCLLFLVRKAFGDPLLRVRWSKSRSEWQAILSDHRGPHVDLRQVSIGSGATEAEALLASFAVFETRVGDCRTGDYTRDGG